MKSMGTNFMNQFDSVFWGKNVMVTGHTGFMGSWLSLWLSLLGANTIGYALDPADERDNFVASGLHYKMIDLRGDIRDLSRLKMAFEAYRPEVVFHLAAQSDERRSRQIPVETLETNIIGTVNVLEAARSCGTVKAVIAATSDKCYENRQQLWGCREDDWLGGDDLFGAGMGCAEMAAAAYRNLYFTAQSGKCAATVRSGNVFGGGDWSSSRLIPDFVRAVQAENPLKIEDPNSMCAWQFVLEPLYGYLLLAKELLTGAPQLQGAWNFGAGPESSVSTGDFVELFADVWGSKAAIQYEQEKTQVYESTSVSLDCTKAKLLLGWTPRLSLRKAMDYTVEWYKNEWKEDYYDLCKRQILSFCGSTEQLSYELMQEDGGKEE